ncbi:MAG: CARDB domain-containing protein, partial [Candidatus Poseidoniaceae archaeon]
SLEYVLPGQCTEYSVPVTKNFDSGDLVFTTPGAPAARPAEIDLTTWRMEQWTVEVDFRDAPGGNALGLNEPRTWEILGGDDSVTHTVYVEVCAPSNATAGLGPAVTLKANLDSYPRISDSVLLSTNVIHVYDLEAGVDPEVGVDLYVNPGEEWLLPITVRNEGNGPDRYDFRLARVTDAAGVDVLWDIDVPRSALQELSRDTYQTFEVRMNIPDQVEAGAYTVVFEAFSEEAYPDDKGRETRLRDTLAFNVQVNEFHDMRISMDPRIDNPVKTSAPGRVVSFEVNITNYGNVPDTPSLHNHTSTRDGDDVLWNTVPGMGSLSSWSVEWMQVEQIGADLFTTVPCEVLMSTASAFPEDRCVYLEDTDTWRMPEMDAYTTIGMVAAVNIGTDATLTTRDIGLKVTSLHGDAEAGGDHDDSPEWAGEDLDSNELIVTLRLRAPNLKIVEAEASQDSAKVGETIPVRVVLANDGNTHATDIEIILCEQRRIDDDIKRDLRTEGCDDEDIVMRQVVGAILAPTDAEEEKQVEIYLLYPVSAGSKAVYVMIDPTNEIVEGSERDNIVYLTEELSSNAPALDVAAEVVSATALPGAVVLLTVALFGVLFLVGAARRGAVKARIAEQSSLMSVLSDEDGL